MRISDWSSDVCSSDLAGQRIRAVPGAGLQVPIWLLGSSLFSAQLAAQPGLPFAFASHFAPELGRASCRESVCQYVYISVVAVQLKQKNKNYSCTRLSNSYIKSHNIKINSHTNT